MDFQTQHTMVLVQEFEDGSQEWHCPACGRRFVMQWPPNYKRTILEEGDADAVHSGGIGGVSMSSDETQQANDAFETEAHFEAADDGQLEADVPMEEDPYLAPFKDWIDQQKW